MAYSGLRAQALGWPNHLSTRLLGPFDPILISRMTDENTNGRILRLES